MARPYTSSADRESHQQGIRESFQKHRDLIEKMIWENIEPTIISKQVSAIAKFPISEALVRNFRKELLGGKVFQTQTPAFFK